MKDKIILYIHGYNQPCHLTGDEDFILHEQNWNNFGYMTTFHMCPPGKNPLGWLHIVQIGQERYENNILSDRLLGRSSCITELPEDFVSVSTDMNLFNNLSNILSYDERLLFIDAMHMALGEDQYLERVRYDKCFNTSVLRNFSYSELVEKLHDAYTIMHSNVI